MATREQLERALVNADAAGDTPAAKKLANAIKNQQFDAPVSEPIEAAAQVEPPFDFSLGEMVSNIPSSAAQFGEDIVQPILNPVDTATSIYNTIRGGMQKLTPGIQEQEQYADAVADFVTNRYGDTEKFKKTLQEDPVGVLGDFASILSLGSTAVPRVGGTVAKIGAAIDPLNIAVKAPVKAIANLPGVNKLPEKLYKSAAKFGTTVSPAARAQMTETALANKIAPDISGVDKANVMINDFNNQIDSMIDASTEKGQRIPRKAMYSNLKELRKDMGGFNLDAADNMKKINSVVRKFETYVKNKSNPYVTPKEVQKFKKDIYKTIDFKKKQGRGSQAGMEARKAIARSAKEQLEKVYPELKGLNAQEGAMIDLRNALERSANRIDNRDMMGIGLPIKAAAGGTIGGAQGAATGVLVSLLDTPAVKAQIAITLRRAQELSLSKRGAVSTGLEIDRQIGRITEDEQN